MEMWYATLVVILSGIIMPLDSAATQDANIAIKPKYCVRKHEMYCPSK